MGLFKGWRDSSALIHCQSRAPSASFMMRGRVVDVDGDRIRLLGDNAELFFDVLDVFTSIEYLEPRGLAAGQSFVSCLIFRVDDPESGVSVADFVFEELIEPSQPS